MLRRNIAWIASRYMWPTFSNYSRIFDCYKLNSESAFFWGGGGGGVSFLRYKGRTRMSKVDYIRLSNIP